MSRAKLQPFVSVDKEVALELCSRVYRSSCVAPFPIYTYARPLDRDDSGVPRRNRCPRQRLPVARDVHIGRLRRSDYSTYPVPVLGQKSEPHSRQRLHPGMMIAAEDCLDGERAGARYETARERRGTSDGRD